MTIKIDGRPNAEEFFGGSNSHCKSEITVTLKEAMNRQEFDLCLATEMFQDEVAMQSV